MLSASSLFSPADALIVVRASINIQRHILATFCTPKRLLPIIAHPCADLASMRFHVASVVKRIVVRCPRWTRISSGNRWYQANVTRLASRLAAFDDEADLLKNLPFQVPLASAR